MKRKIIDHCQLKGLKIDSIVVGDYLDDELLAILVDGDKVCFFGTEARDSYNGSLLDSTVSQRAGFIDELSDSDILSFQVEDEDFLEKRRKKKLDAEKTKLLKDDINAFNRIKSLYPELLKDGVEFPE